MNRLIKGFTYSYNRNIGWQDRTFRSIAGIIAVIAAINFIKTEPIYAVLLVVFAVAQFFTVFSARCIICYFLGRCTIDFKEKKSLDAKGIKYE